MHVKGENHPESDMQFGLSSCINHFLLRHQIAFQRLGEYINFPVVILAEVLKQSACPVRAGAWMLPGMLVVVAVLLELLLRRCRQHVSLREICLVDRLSRDGPSGCFVGRVRGCICRIRWKQSARNPSCARRPVNRCGSVPSRSLKNCTPRGQVLSPLSPVVEPCVVVVNSCDAQDKMDKYFAVAVKSFNPSSSAARSKFPASGFARAAAVTELAEAVPLVRACEEDAVCK